MDKIHSVEKHFAQRYGLLFFAVGAFLITWLTGLFVVLSSHADLVNVAQHVKNPLLISFPVALTLILIGAYGPAFAALGVTAVESGHAGVRALLAQFLRWRVGLGWYALALLGPSLIGLLAVGLYVLVTRTVPEQWWMLPNPLRFGLVLLGPWGEELGWRGYALPKLQSRWGAFGASGLVALIWFSWHQWPLFTPAREPNVDWVGLVVFLGYLFAVSVLMTWLYNSTSGSLPIAWAAHAGLNLMGTMVPLIFVAVMFSLAATLVLLLNGPQTLSRVEIDSQ